MRRVLASASPRRREILETLRIPFEVIPSRAEENPVPGLSARELAVHLAHLKAGEVAARERGWVLGADTIVVVDGVALGKPADDEDAARMLRQLSGSVHEVVTGVALHGGGDAREIAVSTRVWFRELTPERVRRYVATGEGRDKAGAYAVQGIGAGLVHRIDGSWSNVVGLPAAETVDLLEAAGALDAWP